MDINLTTKDKAILVIILFIVVGYFGSKHLRQSQPVTAESQQQAETPQGVALAAKDAHITMLQSQLDEASKQIALLKNKPPDTIIKTVPVEVEKTVIKEVEKRGADFAIATNPANPDKTVDLKDVAKLPADTPVALNQYNVFAYKKIIHGVNIYPSFTGIKPTGISEVTYDVSHKVSNDGRYIGVVGGYEFYDKKCKLGLRYSF